MAAKHCLRCNYVLDGLGERRQCPECGYVFDPHDPATYRPRFKSFRWREQIALTVFLPLMAVGAALALAAGPARHMGLHGTIALGAGIAGVAMMLIGFAATQWLRWDLQWIAFWDARELEIEESLDWKSLNLWYEQRLTSRRPFVRLYDGWIVPGVIDLRYACQARLFGEEGEALTLALKALATTSQTEHHLQAMVMHAMGLSAVGQYSEAQAVCEEVARRGDRGNALEVMAMNALLQGHVAEAYALAQDSGADAATMDSWKLIALILLGRDEEAVTMGEAQAAAAARVLHSISSRQALSSDPDARQKWSLEQRIPALRAMIPRLHLAQLHLERGRAAEAARQLDVAGGILILNPTTRVYYHGMRAWVLSSGAAGGSVADELKAMWLACKRTQKGELMWQAHYNAAASALARGDLIECQTNLDAATKLARHPIEHHQQNLWRARLAERRGDTAAAIEHYRRVTADGFETRMHAEAVAALRRLAPSGGDRT